MTRDEKIAEALRRLGKPVPPTSKVRSTPVSLPPLAECVHLGKRIPGQPCGSPLYGCTKHNAITTRFVKCSGATLHCATCKDYTPPNSPDHPNIAEAARFSLSTEPYPQGRYSGTGVVIVGGGKYWPSAYVTVRMLRHVGCDLPIQLWYLGEQERDERYLKILPKYGVEVVDATAHPLAATTRSKLIGFPTSPAFEVKTFAALHSPFEEVLVLDADSYPCTDPTVLFDDSRYRQTGGIFWPDLPNTNSWTKWKDWGVDKFGPDCGWEVGQYVLHKSTAWRQLNLARWYDDHGDWCYGAQVHHDHGDKGTHRVAWAMHRTEPTFFTTKGTWKILAFVQVGPDGKTPMFIHRCRSKFTLTPTPYSSTVQNGINLRGGLPLEVEAFRYLGELRGELAGV